MIPVFQTKFTGEVGCKLGNCLAACFASLLEIPLSKVPAFESMASMYSNGEIHNIVLAFLKANGHEYVDWHTGMPPDDGEYYLTSFKVPRRTIRHCVIVRNDEIVHDPHPVERRVVLGKVVDYVVIRKVI